MENRKKRNIGGTIFLVAAGAALTVVGFMFIPPLIQKYGNKAYKVEQIYVFPNIELRLDTFVGKGSSSVNYHVIFSASVSERDPSFEGDQWLLPLLITRCEWQKLL